MLVHGAYTQHTDGINWSEAAYKKSILRDKFPLWLCVLCRFVRFVPHILHSHIVSIASRSRHVNCRGTEFTQRRIERTKFKQIGSILETQWETMFLRSQQTFTHIRLERRRSTSNKFKYIHVGRWRRDALNRLAFIVHSTEYSLVHSSGTYMARADSIVVPLHAPSLGDAQFSPAFCALTR